MPGEQLETLDHVVRTLDPDDILITDSSGPISLAGTMGGLATEVSETSTDLVIEAAHFSAPGVARTSRRHRLFSQASARFERGVDYELPLRASAKAAAMLAELGGGTAVEGYTLASAPITPVRIVIPADHPDRVAGASYGTQTVVSRLREVGCAVERAERSAGGAASERAATLLTVTPPSWRPDLTDPNDLAEEVIRLEGYEKIGMNMPRALAGKGRTPTQRLRMAVGERARRSRLHRGAQQPVRLGGRLRPAAARCRRRSAAGDQPGQPDQGRGAADADLAAAWPVPRGGT